MIDDEMVRLKGETYHAYHFSCKSCGSELNAATAREIRAELYCLKCQDKLEIAVCAACHTPIDQERIVYALGKQWHVEVNRHIKNLRMKIIKARNLNCI